MSKLKSPHSPFKVKISMLDEIVWTKKKKLHLSRVKFKSERDNRFMYKLQLNNNIVIGTVIITVLLYSILPLTIEYEETDTAYGFRLLNLCLYRLPTVLYR